MIKLKIKEKYFKSIIIIAIIIKIEITYVMWVKKHVKVVEHTNLLMKIMIYNLLNIKYEKKY